MKKFEAKLHAFRTTYPAYRRKGGSEVTQAFARALRKVPYGVMLHALEQHKRSVQWQTPRFIPAITTWLNEERWIQILPEPPAAKVNVKRMTPYQHAKYLGLK